MHEIADENPPSKLTYIIIGGALASLMNVVPVLNYTTCLFGLSNGVGAYGALALWLGSSAWGESARFTRRDVMIFGCGTGILSALIGGPIKILLKFRYEAQWLPFFSDLSEYPLSFAAALWGAIFGWAIFGSMMGTLWAMAGADLYHKDRLVS